MTRLQGWIAIVLLAVIGLILHLRLPEREPEPEQATERFYLPPEEPDTLNLPRSPEPLRR